jgi:murein L,D-transpeptidase YafK
MAAAFLAACQGATIDDLTPKADRDLPPLVLTKMKSKGMTRSSPIMMRIFKEDSTLEIWKQKDNGRYDLIGSYKICRWSGKLGPKKVEGDRQAPEGFYYIHPWQMNPKSNYYLSFNIGYPNAYDKVLGRTGTNLMIHGACSSAGCYSMTDENVAQIYAFARDAIAGGQEAFLVEAFPFRMTPENMAKHRDDPNFAFWQMLKPGYDDFEITHVPPKVDVCDRKYVVDVAFDGDAKPNPAASCPPSTTPASLIEARAEYDAQYRKAFDKEVAKLEREQPATALASAPSATQAPTLASAGGNPVQSSSAAVAGVPVPQANPTETPAQTAAEKPARKHWWSAFSGD